MTNKYFKFIITTAVILCVLCSSLTVAFAAPSETEESTDPIETTEEQSATEEESTTAPNGGLIIGEDTTVADTAKPTTKPTTQPQTTRQNVTQIRPSYNTQITQNTQGKTTTKKADEVVADVTTTKPAETTLPEGSFYVYLELNNGQPRLKRVLTEPGLVPEPNEPVRKGYVFDGWFADAKFTKPWNFFTSIANENTIIYAKWVADASTVVFNVKISEMVGGTVQVNPMTASEGEPVIITVLPEEGKRIVAGSLRINGKSSDVFSFIMPAQDVVISAQFEDIPESALDDSEDKSILPFVIGGIIIVIAIVVVVLVILRRRAELDEIEFDENGALILDDDDDEGWIDESIVIEDGFADGKIVRENVEPDFGEPEIDNDY